MKYNQHGINAYRKTLNTVKEASEKDEDLFAFLSDVPDEDIKYLFNDEDPGTLTKVLPLLDTARKKIVINSLLPAKQQAVIKGLLSKQVLMDGEQQTISKRLREKVALLEKDKADRIDGPSVLSAIMLEMNPLERQSLLKDLHQSSPDIARLIENKVVELRTLEDVVERDRQEFLSSLDDNTILTLMAVYGDKSADLILNQLSKRRQAFIIQYLKSSPPPSASERAAIKDSFLEQLKQGVLDGNLRLKSDEWIE
ncbi:FliG C-terminal domain-containing protein [Spirochaeta cellobiosiphila]|uniref:FliG C-terminal domain-containing protein n=1 Tax=Spirochaeta cellobiosiphila TaxID=504483 RepID=UPI000409E06C|nr:FliG C-terminal domain-containing protein [Spirochaeta cellobiosiphila]